MIISPATPADALFQPAHADAISPRWFIHFRCRLSYASSRARRLHLFHFLDFFSHFLSAERFVFFQALSSLLLPGSHRARFSLQSFWFHGTEMVRPTFSSLSSVFLVFPDSHSFLFGSFQFQIVSSEQASSSSTLSRRGFSPSSFSLFYRFQLCQRLWEMSFLYFPSIFFSIDTTFQHSTDTLFQSLQISFLSPSYWWQVFFSLYAFNISYFYISHCFMFIFSTYFLLQLIFLHFFW